MPKSAMIRARVDPELKAEVESIFRDLGLSITEAITLFYQQVSLRRGLPFEVRIPNEDTIRTFETTDRGEDVTQAEDAEDLFDRLEL